MHPNTIMYGGDYQSMQETIILNINGETYEVTVDAETPLLYVLRNDVGLNAPKFGCGLEQCGSCKVLVDGNDVPSCQLPVSQVQGLTITTVEGLAPPDELHPLQEAFIFEQAAQCGFCSAGMIIAAQGLLNRTRYPSDEEIKEALANNLCRCGVYDRIRRAIKARIGRPHSEPIYEVITDESLQDDDSVELPRVFQQTPDLDSWLRINEDESITIFSGKAELGQGIKTALAQIAADELDVSFHRIRVQMADTEQTPDEGGTTGSMSLQTSGNAIRIASAEARFHLLSGAFEHLESLTPMSDLQVLDGMVTDPATGGQVSYWDLMAGKKFERLITGQPAVKAEKAYKTVGKSEQRIDLLDKFTGRPAYVQDMTLPDMLHARVLRPPGYHARLTSFDADSIRRMPGVETVIVDGSFIAIVASREEQAVRALEKSREIASWSYEKSIPPQENLFDDLLRKPAQSNLIVDGSGTDEPIPDIQAPDSAAKTLTASYFRPYHMHASIAPSAAIALWQDDKLRVWSHTQAVFSLRASLAQVLEIDPGQIRVIHTEGAGCYGHNGADDVALDAALLARELQGIPVSLKWMRSDEHGWEPYGSAMALKMQASLDNEGRIIDWNHDVWSYGHSTRPRPGDEVSGLLASWHLKNAFSPQQPRPISGYHFGAHRNADPKYDFERKRVVRHEAADSPLRVSALRSLGAYANIFAIESFMDELALAAGRDPLQFRLNHLQDVRAKAVLEAVAKKADWHSRSSEEGYGWGIAFAQYKNRQCYAAIVVKVHVNRETGEIKLERAFIAADAGQTVNPDGLSNQLEGGFVQAASWTLLEEVKFNEQGITSLDWDSYPILRATATPEIETVIINRPGMPFLGAGEATQNPTPAAIANAVYDAVAIRLRHIPFTPDKVKEALKNNR